MSIDTRLTRIIDELVDAGIPMQQAMVQFERKYVKVALDRTKGNITRASLKLGVHRNTLHNKLRLMGYEERR